MDAEKKLTYKSIGEIGNYYGGLFVMEHDGKYYWTIEDYSTSFDDLSCWSEISKELYSSLMSYESNRQTDEKVDDTSIIPDHIQPLHNCVAESDVDVDSHGIAIDCCWEDDADGKLWVGNGEYANTVSYCPFCGYKSPK